MYKYFTLFKYFVWNKIAGDYYRYFVDLKALGFDFE